MPNRPRYGIRLSAAIPNVDVLKEIVPLAGCEIREIVRIQSTDTHLSTISFGQEIWTVVGPEGMEQSEFKRVMSDAEGLRNLEYMQEQKDQDYQLLAAATEAPKP